MEEEIKRVTKEYSRDDRMFYIIFGKAFILLFTYMNVLKCTF